MTVVNNQYLGSSPTGIFLDTNDTVYTVAHGSNLAQIWLQGTGTPLRNISVTLPNSIFVTLSGDIYVDDYTTSNGTIHKWTSDANTSQIVMYTNTVCYGLFVDLYENIYCSDGLFHRVLKKSFNAGPTSIHVIVGNGSNGSASNQLSGPRGVFVDSSFNLYVAESGNNRIQLFHPGQLNGTTVVGTGAPKTIALYSPTGVVLDASGYLFICDRDNHRIVAGGPAGYRCIAGCLRSTGSSASELDTPRRLSFDSNGNIFITDSGNVRIQKFVLAVNSCRKR